MRDLVGLLEELSQPTTARVVVFDSADPDFFFPHVDLTKVPEYTAEAAKAKRGFQTRGRTELELGDVIGDLKALD
ncbi:hypothetical protein [Streptomyces yatensis]|uniref:Uncharacterized protein n=1 Tax=Streptomyces yatensis TaxID=155177 RepID=A0ABN2I230_9ACTN|nr:hypothetical protein [Streptomyces yatensis]